MTRDWTVSNIQTPELTLLAKRVFYRNQKIGSLKNL